MVAVCRGFLDDLHTRSLNALTTSLDSEPWATVIVPHDYQRLLDELIGVTVPEAPTPNLEPQAEAPALQLAEDRRVPVCSSTLLALKSTSSYVRFAQALSPSVPTLAVDCSRFLGELLHVLNSRAYALVLRQGAVHTGALKTITARHLAVVAASLDVLETLARALRTSLGRALTGIDSRLVQEQYSQLIKHLEEHSQQLHDKFVELMVERALSIVPRLITGPLPGATAEETTSVVSPVAGLGLDELDKKLLVLHKTLHGTLSRQHEHSVLVRVLNAWRRVLREHLGSSPVVDEARKAALLREARVLDEHCRRVLGLQSAEAEAVALVPIISSLPVLPAGGLSTPSAVTDDPLHAAQRFFNSALNWPGKS